MREDDIPMTTQTTTRAPHRAPLSRERVLDAAIRLADAGGLGSLSMRKLGHELGVEAMAIYYHFANKERVLDGMVDLVFAEIELPVTGTAWKTAMRRRAISVRDAMARHPWAIGMMESRRDPGPANLRHHDAVIGSLRAGGFDMTMAAHAYAVLDGYIYGFALTHVNLPFGTADEAAAVAESMVQPFEPGTFPNLVAMIEHAMQPGYDYANEFGYGLDLILDGLQRVLDRA
jgi:AcrR family transcriptional regulator